MPQSCYIHHHQLIVKEKQMIRTRGITQEFHFPSASCLRGSSGAVIRQNFVAVSDCWFFFFLFWNWTATYVIRHLLLQFFFLDQFLSSDPSFAICNCEAHTCDERNSVPPLLFPLFVRVTNFFLSSELMTELCLTTVIRDARCGEFCQNGQLKGLGRSMQQALRSSDGLTAQRVVGPQHPHQL